MRRNLFLTTLILLAAVHVSVAEDQELGFTFDLSYHSKWLSKGAEGYGQQGALFKTLDIDLWGSGFGFKVTHRNATAGGYVDKTRFDYRPYYKGLLFEGAPYQTNYNISAGYEHYPGLARHKANTTWEWIFAFSWPNLLPEGLTPQYIAHYEYPASGGDINRKVAGWVHRFILGYDMGIAELPQPLHLSSEVAYYDGLGANAHDWGYATFGLSTKLKVNENLDFIPGIYQQITMDDSVSKRKDITYCILTMKYKF